MATLCSHGRVPGHIGANMSYRVDLILESEQRSGSLLSPKSLMRIICTVLPVVILCFVAVEVMQAWSLKSEVGRIEAEWDRMRPEQREASMVRSNLTVSTEVVAEMTSWRNSRLAWETQLLSLQTLVPEDVQLTLIRSDQRIRLENKSLPVRDFTVVIKGRAVGISAKENVEALEQSVNDTDCFKEVQKEAKVTSFVADQNKDADKLDRVFEMVCKYKPKAFK